MIQKTCEGDEKLDRKSCSHLKADICKKKKIYPEEWEKDKINIWGK